jgi:hypothetical protein
MLATPAVLWEQMNAGSERARRAVPAETCVRRFLLAGMPVEFTFIGSNLCNLISRSLAHLIVEGCADFHPVLRIDLWDESLTGVTRPLGDLREAFEESINFADGILAGAPGADFVGQQNPRACTLINFESNRIIGCVGSSQALSRSEIAKPLQPILFAWYNSHRIQPVHAGLVARGDDGVLIGGAGGSGKSTTSLLCVRAGFSYLADDYVGLPPAANGRQTAYSFYTSLWLEEEHSKKFQWLLANRIEAQLCGDEKLPFGVAETFPGSMATQCTVRAVVLPKVVDISHSRLRPATAAEALLKLAPSSVLQLPFIQPAIALERIAALLRSVPSFWLDLGSDFDSIPLCVTEALELAMGSVAVQSPRGPK